jgi:hypothetical protein
MQEIKKKKLVLVREQTWEKVNGLNARKIYDLVISKSVTN